MVLFPCEANVVCRPGLKCLQDMSRQTNTPLMLMHLSCWLGAEDQLKISY